jgi:choloylglycine hydrolase
MTDAAVRRHGKAGANGQQRLDEGMSGCIVQQPVLRRIGSMEQLEKPGIWKAVLATMVALSVAEGAWACSRILWNDNALAVVVGRTMDWPESTEPVITVLPRGMERDGGRIGGEIVVAENAATWTSKYGSMVTTVYGVGTADGFNEAGLAAHMLYLTATDFGPRDPARPGLQAGLWAQYLLDNAASVDEALALMDDVQIVMTEARGSKTSVHLAIEDASGDSAIIEFVDGEQRVHHGREHVIMTNDPPYDEQIALLAQFDYSNPSSEMPLPGNVQATDRFQRAAYYHAMLPEPTSERAAIAGILAIARNVSVPFGAPYKGFGIYNTEYRTAINVTDGRYFFELTTAPNVIWAALADFDIAPGAPVMLLDPDDVALAGDVSSAFTAGEAPF